jgi:gamma-glutamyl hydrolase
MVILFNTLLAAALALDWRIHNLPDKTQTPVFAVLTLPLTTEFKVGFNTSANAYVASSYVKFLEMSGAQVIPLFSNSSKEEVDQILSWVNGVLFTGGDYPFWVTGEKPVLTPDYAETGCYVMKQVELLSQKGIVLPLWATCLGFELIHVCKRNQFDTIGNFTGMPPYSKEQEFKWGASKSAVFTFRGKETKEVMKILSQQKLSSLAHNFGVSPKTYEKSFELKNSFQILSTIKDQAGLEFVGFIEGKTAPIFGTQFHPEKNSFEFGRTTIPHTNDGIYAMSYFSQFLVSLSKKNSNNIPPEELEKRQMFNFPPVRTHFIFTSVILFP